MGTKREEPLTTEEFAYMAAVFIHAMEEKNEGPGFENWIVENTPYTREEVKALLDEAYRRRLD